MGRQPVRQPAARSRWFRSDLARGETAIWLGWGETRMPVRDLALPPTTLPRVASSQMPADASLRSSRVVAPSWCRSKEVITSLLLWLANNTGGKMPISAHLLLTLISCSQGQENEPNLGANSSRGGGRDGVGCVKVQTEVYLPYSRD